jgi:hypothetical protein
MVKIMVSYSTFDVDDNAQVRVQCDNGRSCGCWALGQGAGLLHQYYCQGLGGFAIFREAEDNGREDGANEVIVYDHRTSVFLRLWCQCFDHCNVYLAERTLRKIRIIGSLEMK